MEQFREIEAHELSGNPFKMIGKEWMLITASKSDTVNTMTASWGGLGVMWNKNVSYIVIRPQRYTKEFVDSSNYYSLCFFDESYKKTLGYLGKVSGREEDKITNAQLTVDYIEGIPYFKEATKVILCKSLFASPYTEEDFIDKSLISVNYPNRDFHTLYIGEVLKVLIKE